MIPISLDPARIRIAIAGAGPAAVRRRQRLTTGGAVVQPFPISDGQADFSTIDLLWIADLPKAQVAELAARARAAGVLVNVEDRPDLCDFHNVAELRRGDLLIGVSTAGRSPALAARVRDLIAALIGSEWERRLSRIATLRSVWRAAGKPMDEISRLTAASLEADLS